MRPQTLKEVVGQNKTKETLNILVNSARIRKAACPHIIFFGPSGCGKTTLARAVSTELNSKCHELNGASLRKPEDLRLLLNSLSAQDVILIDEIHSMNNRVSEFLYTIMEDSKYFDPRGRAIKVPPVTFIGATTEIGSLLEPLRNRFKYECEIERYSLDELVEIAINIEILGVEKLPRNVAEIICKTCRSTPRLVVNRTEFVRDYLLTNPQQQFTREKLLSIIALQGVDENGFTALDRRYLDELSDTPISLRSIAAKLRESPETILNKVEPFLLEKGLLEITKGGRVLPGSSSLEKIDFEDLF